MPRSFVRKLATFCRPRLDIQPVDIISRILASTNGIPVYPAEEKAQFIEKIPSPRIYLSMLRIVVNLVSKHTVQISNHVRRKAVCHIS